MGNEGVSEQTLPQFTAVGNNNSTSVGLVFTSVSKVVRNELSLPYRTSAATGNVSVAKQSALQRLGQR